MDESPAPSVELSALHEFGALLRMWRERRNLSQAALARQVPVHRDLIAKIENARRWPSDDLARRCDLILQTGGCLATLWPRVDEEHKSRRLHSAYARITDRLRDSGHIAQEREQPGSHVPRPEAELFGRESVVIVTPVKREEIRARPVVALEDVVGAQRLAEAVRLLGLTPTFETVPTSGEIDLNRPNLVVICGPRLSGQHPAQPTDVAYLGRLPRPDGKGMLMIFTGIHPQGSLGVVELLSTWAADLHRAVRHNLFSVLVGTEYHPDNGEPRHVELLTPVYQWSKAID